MSETELSPRCSSPKLLSNIWLVPSRLSCLLLIFSAAEGSARGDGALRLETSQKQYDVFVGAILLSSDYSRVLALVSDWIIRIGNGFDCLNEDLPKTASTCSLGMYFFSTQEKLTCEAGRGSTVLVRRFGDYTAVKLLPTFLWSCMQSMQSKNAVLGQPRSQGFSPLRGKALGTRLVLDVQGKVALINSF